MRRMGRELLSLVVGGAHGYTGRDLCSCSRHGALGEENAQGKIQNRKGESSVVGSIYNGTSRFSYLISRYNDRTEYRTNGTTETQQEISPQNPDASTSI